MSTKIYSARRCSPKYFENFLQNYREHCFIEAAKKLKTFGDYYLEEDLTKEIRKIYNNFPWEMSFEEFLKERYSIFGMRANIGLAIKGSLDHTKNLFDIDCSLNVWWFKNKFYIIFYGEYYDNFEFPLEIEDYCYWNNTDHPENISYSKWKNRGKNWDLICNNWDSRMSQEIITASKDIGLIDVLRKTNVIKNEEFLWAASQPIEIKINYI